MIDVRRVVRFATAIGLLAGLLIGIGSISPAAAQTGIRCNPDQRDGNPSCTLGDSRSEKCRRVRGSCGLFHDLCIDDPTKDRATAFGGSFLCNLMCRDDRGICESGVVPCNSDQDCKANRESCRLGVCFYIVDSCSANADCDSNERCQGNRCIAATPPSQACTTNSQCGAEQACRSGLCRRRLPPPACTARSQCASDEICHDSRCVAI